MTIGALLVGLSLVILTASFVLRPLAERGDSDDLPQEHEPPPELGQVLAALRDLDFDHRMGKVVEHDYTPARALLLARAAEAMIDTRGPMLDDALEARVDEIRRQIREGNPTEACPACGHRRLAGDRYCPQCGSPQAGACPACGRAFALQDHYCVGCGLRLEPRPASGA